MQTSADIAARYAAALVGGFADAGVELAIVSPGSRNTPVTLALANEPRIRDISIRDERTAGFLAVGFAKANGMPAIVSCTSGSAATHYFPAIVEADQSTTPMIVLTADRPLRLRGTGAPQSMDQKHLFGSHVTKFEDLDVLNVDSAHTDAIALVQGATSGPPGPVHANLPFDEPLLPSEPAPAPRRQQLARDEGGTDAPHLLNINSRSAFIVVGGRGTNERNEAIRDLSQRLAAPIFGDPQTNLAGGAVLSHGDILVSVQDDRGSLAMATHPPDTVIRVGPIPTSQSMWRWLESSNVDQILINDSRLSDPLNSARQIFDGDVVTNLRGIGTTETRSKSFLESWHDMDRTVGSALERAIPILPFPNEPSIAQTIASCVPVNTALVVASSRPIRDVDAYGTPRAGIDIIANRGVNGIDGTISTALGVAVSGQPTTLLTGDVAALHDVGTLAELARLGATLRIIVVNNDGGGIFSFLPQATSDMVDSKVFERHWGTPHGLSLARIAAAMGIKSRQLKTREQLEKSTSKPVVEPELLELVTARSELVEHHAAIRHAASDALTSHLSTGSE